MAQQPIDQSQLDPTLDAQSLQGQTIGTGANQIVQLDGSSALPAVDGSNLTGLSGGTFDGDKAFQGTGNQAFSTTTLTDVTNMAVTLPALGQYRIEIWQPVSWSPAGTRTGLEYLISTFSGTTPLGTTIAHLMDGQAGGAIVDGITDFSGPTAAVLAATTIGNAHVLKIEGTISVAAGTPPELRLQLAANGGASGTLNALGYGHIVLTRVDA